MIDRITLDERLDDTHQDPFISTDVSLDVEIVDPGRSQHAAPIGGNLEAIETELTKWIDDDHDPAATSHLDKGPHESRMVRRGIRPDDEDQVAMIEVLEHDGRGP